MCHYYHYYYVTNPANISDLLVMKLRLGLRTYFKVIFNEFSIAVNPESLSITVTSELRDDLKLSI